MPNPLFVGIDVSSKDNVVCCLTNADEKRPLSRFTVLNNRPGILELKERISHLVKKHNFDEIRFGLEHTGCYSTHAAMYLQRHLEFGCPNVNVYMFNPSLIKEFKKAHFLDAPKNDRADAWYIAARLKSGHLPYPFIWSEPMMALQRLTRARYHLMKALIRESNFLMTNLYLKWSDYTLVFDNKLSATSLAVMEEFESTEALAEISMDKLVDFLVQHGKNRFDDPQAVAEDLKKAARSSYRLPKAVNDSVNLAMASSIRVIRTIQEQLKSLKKAIKDHLDAIPQTLSQASALYMLPESWLKSAILNSLKATNSWLSSQAWHGRNINQENLLPVKHGLFIPVTAFYGTIFWKRLTVSGCTTLFLPSTMLRKKRNLSNSPINVPLHLLPENWCGWSFSC